MLREKENRKDISQTIGILMLVFVIAGFYGWCYEIIFYYFNYGMKQIYMKGGNFLPWINIYAIGSILILLLTKHFKKKPYLVFIISLAVSGILEYVAGWLVYKIGNGLRYWNYNVEIWNFGNINGFVCLRSVLVFGMSSMILMYIILPVLEKISDKMKRKKFITLSVVLFSVVMADEIYNFLASHVFGWPDAITIYTNIGLKYMEL